MHIHLGRRENIFDRDKSEFLELPEMRFVQIGWRRDGLMGRDRSGTSYERLILAGG